MTAAATSAQAGRESLRLLVSLLALAAAALLLAIAFRPAAHIHDAPLTEDGYYALSIARNIAAGKGITIDGERLTNGFQPLFTLIEAGAFRLAGADEETSIRLVLGAAWLMHILGALVIGLIARDAWPTAPGIDGEAERRLRFALGAFLYIASPLLLQHAYNGLETGCVMLFYALAWRLAQNGVDRAWSGLAVYGAVIGLMLLARIDTAVLALVLGVNELRKSRQSGFATMLGRAATLGGAALIVSSPWWIYNVVYFGSPMPTSGGAQQIWAFDWQRIESGEQSLRIAAVPWVFLGSYENCPAMRAIWPFGEPWKKCLVFDAPWPSSTGQIRMSLIGWLRAALALAAAVTLWHAARRGVLGRDRAGSDERQRAATACTLEFASCFAVAMAGLVAYYIFSFVTSWFYYRYFAPIAVFATVFAAVLWARLAGAWPGRVGRFGHAILALGLGLQIGAMAWFTQDGGGIANDTVYYDQVALARDYVPDGERVAGGQTGTLGYFRDRVVNVDGKVNRDALVHQDRMWDYLRAEGIGWFIDWPRYVRKYLDVPLDDRQVPLKAANGWRYVADRNSFYVYEYVGDGAKQ